ncbi:hypothetical protein D3C80_1883820 [compost metagenome]
MEAIRAVTQVPTLEPITMAIPNSTGSAPDPTRVIVIPITAALLWTRAVNIAPAAAPQSRLSEALLTSQSRIPALSSAGLTDCIHLIAIMIKLKPAAAKAPY